MNVVFKLIDARRQMKFISNTSSKGNVPCKIHRSQQKGTASVYESRVYDTRDDETPGSAMFWSGPDLRSAFNVSSIS